MEVDGERTSVVPAPQLFVRGCAAARLPVTTPAQRTALPHSFGFVDCEATSSLRKPCSVVSFSKTERVDSNDVDVVPSLPERGHAARLTELLRAVPMVPTNASSALLGRIARAVGLSLGRKDHVAGRTSTVAVLVRGSRTPPRRTASLRSTAPPRQHAPSTARTRRCR